MIKFMLLQFIAACGNAPEVVLKEKGRPLPIECARTGEGSFICSDGAGIIWTCGFNLTNDAECISTGKLQPEAT